MRIGTWNLEGRWTPGHRELLERAECDLWLLTEVAVGTRLAGYASVTTVAHMAPGRAWAAVLSRGPLQALPDPHAATAAGRVGDTVVLSSVLPWRSCGQEPPWTVGDQGKKTRAAVTALTASVEGGPVVWGGDLNHALEGSEVAGSAAGVEAIRNAGDRWGLQWATVGQPHRIAGVLTIDHVGVPAGWGVSSVSRYDAPPQLSDHDLYVVEVDATL